jgi:hypothetical protein
MDRPPGPDGPQSYYARFEGGPRDATQTVVLGLDSGQPPELLLTPGKRDWIYVLAGNVRGDGSLPYMWMPKSRIAALQRRAGNMSTDMNMDAS